MDREKLKEKVLGLVPGLQSEETRDFTAVTVAADNLHALALQLKNDPDLLFDSLLCLSGVDWGKELGVVYLFESTKQKHMLEVKVKTTDREKPCFDTLSDIWSGAILHEMEVFDLFGIFFKGHPDMRRIFLAEDWVGYPLRKDYVDEVNIVEL
ncbi:MAG TPA: NADH-quinone oxidoreductase subunit C [Bacteroidales bacterium]|nr:NADH-quinone oxidoreductase subunit C [Bacteroidales bacterium]HPS72990.1 NADH-quinone oxidoreductase subunit C [Bacteroidales bacterium]